MEHFFSILGGMGTMATESFVHLLNERVVTHKDQDYLNYVLFNHATVPDRTAYILDATNDSPLPYLLDDIEKQNLLKPDFIVLTCNTAHHFFDTLQAATPIPILHMPKEAVKEVLKQKEVGKVAFFGTTGSVKAGIYETQMRQAGLEVYLPTEKLQDKINHLIYHDIKENDFLNQSLYVEILKDAVDAGCKQIILGCTELSLMEASFGQHDYPVIDAQSVLVDRTIERALALRKE
ncbi:amino acid racemase [Enterococcus aquimarinus]|uniref:Amino acid racemase n=1 Tax=Enterococcus aquimarinus TaxID=328396 RepID=A0A1L8QNM0_9ENTE|nr:amino acid racemase [Enterococcus aquimarinus]MCC9274137.1 amino acid racemase [Enterococcus aquimarinus]OJG09079.1 aspartate racemase [Enterococcus aquimarinus]